MALKRLAIPEMISISEPWITKSTPQRKALAAKSELAPVFQKVEQAHAALLATQPPQATGKLAALTEQAAAADATHDQLARAVDGIMTGYVLVAQDADQAQQLASLHDKLLPDGLTIINKSYREEAGAVRMVQERLTDVDRAALKKLTLPGSRNVLGLVEDWIAAGVALGKIEDTRAAEQGVPEGMSAADVLRARNKWIRSVNALQSMAELHEVDDATMQLVFNAMWLAERAAGRRGTRKAASDQEPPPAASGGTAPSAPPAG